MSVPFSNTHLRVPRGFGALLEGLTREVLRDQPDNIPAYAAQYFDKLLKEREESGADPSEWAAKLEDRFYNNHAFKSTETFSPEKETAAEEADVSK
ncbi:sperm surface protein Sp17 [Poecilia latipinna]|uniref:sperm surface protein Sp17 n=1 Tax=Poecilia latipinna TaxID=48699 RepID=UPI00072DAE59|nr:PREDICTED: sperm surface protein Sp17 [Poecilia latipinna]XP_016525665.1 PREDICTED: sperm surface protein Sp17 [Poecilia formosa]